MNLSTKAVKKALLKNKQYKVNKRSEYHKPEKGHTAAIKRVRHE